MSDAAHSDAHAASHDESLFSPVEVEQFAADDVQAGGAIGKMLSALFLYTVFAMGIAGWWTYSAIMTESSAAEETDKHDDHDHKHADQKADH
jgi:hypothetical protein